MKKQYILIAFVLISLFSFSQVPSYVPTNGLVGWLPFSGNPNDLSGNNLNGIVTGATLTSDRFGNVNSAYNFDYATVGFGTQTDEIYIPYSPILNSTAVSISVWVYQRQYVWPGNMNPPMSTIAARFQYGYSNPNGQVWMLNSGTNGINGFSGAPNISLNTWTHIVTTFDNGTGKIYINGTLVSSQSNLSPLNINGNSGISIGQSNQANGYWWPTDGIIDDFGLWNRALTQQEITNLYTSSVPPTCSISASASEVCAGSPVTLTCQANVPANDTVLVEQFTLNALQAFNHTTPILNTNTNYLLKVSGTVGFAGGVNSQDAAYQYNWFGSPVTPWPFPNATDVWWFMNGSSNFRPSPDTYNSNHIYYFPIQGNNQPVNFSWTDNPYSDNSGSLTFQLYRIEVTPVTYSWSPSGATTQSITVSPTSTTTYTCTVTANSQSCSSSQTIEVLQPAITTTSNAICSGQSTTLTASMPVNTACPTLNGTLTNGLIGFWPFCGNANDASGNGNNGTVNGATLTTDRFGNANSAYSFDGVDDYISGISTNLSVQSTDKLTMTAWVKVNQFAPAPAASKLITHTDNSNNGQQYALSIGNDGSLYFLAGNGDFENNGPNISSPGQISLNNWKHIGIVTSDDSVKLFIDGVMVSGKAENDVFPNSPTGKFIFSSITNTTFNKLFNGTIDDIAIWNRALTTSEIQQLYNQGQISYLWSNGATTQSITVSPAQTTTYTCDVTVNGLTCSDDVTVTVLQPTASSIQHITCSSYSAPDGSVYISSGTYQAVIPNAQGCDSTITINLTVNNPTTSVIAPTVCTTYTAPDGSVFTSSGTYQAVIPNAQGCDSTITINLTVNTPTTSVIAPTVCSAYTAPDGSVYTSSGTYQAVIPNAQGCDSTITINLTVHPLPTVGAGNDFSVCEGEQITLSGSGASSYTWDNGVNDGLPFTEQGTMTYTVTGTDGNNCSNTDQVTVTVNPLPTIDAGSDQVVCEGDPVTLSASGGDSYSWDNGVTNGSVFTPTHIGDLTYTVSGTDANNCSNTDQVVVTVNVHTSATQTATGLDSYTWPVNGQTYTQSGTYTAVIPNSAGCDSTITLNLTLSFTGLEEIAEGIRIFPNPAHDALTIESSSALVGEFRLYDAAGRIILTGNFMGEITTIDVRNIAPGTYTLQGLELVERIVVVKGE